MGNDILRHYPGRKNLISKLTTNTKHTSFIIELNHQSTHLNSTQTQICSLDKLRVVFVSLIGLFQTYRSCPLHTLYSALYILPIKKKWLYNLPKYIYKDPIELQHITSLTIFNSASETLQFIRMLQWKDSQGLLIFMLDEYKDNDPLCSSLIHPFWRYLSHKICTLYDTQTGHKYNSLNLNDKYWETKSAFKYGVTTSSILNELYFKTMKFKTIQEILYQSNPSMNPVIYYGQNIDYFKILKDIEKENKEGKWYISIDYDM